MRKWRDELLALLFGVAMLAGSMIALWLMLIFYNV